MPAPSAKRILVVDDEPAVVRALGVRCGQLGVQVCEAGSAAEALAVIRDPGRPPDLVLLDLDMPGADGLTLCDLIKTDPQLPPLPVVLLTGHTDEATRARCARVGAHFVAKDTEAWPHLEPLIRRLLDLPGAAAPAAAAPSSSVGRPTLLLIDDDVDWARALGIRLKSAGYAVLTADGGMQGYWMALKSAPDLILLDYRMPEAMGNTILGKLKSNPMTREIPVIILSGLTDCGVQRDILRLGAECWVNKPVDTAQLRSMIEDHLGAARRGR